MSWVRLDDQFADHPKVIAAGPAAAWLFVCGLGYCARYLTDGFIPAGQVRKLADLENTASLVTALLTAGMWESVDGGYHVHDYLDYQPSAEQVKAERAKAAQRQDSWRKRHHGNAASNAVTNASPVPIPIPIDPERETRAREVDNTPRATAASLSLVKPSETADPEPARPEPHTEGAPPPSDPKADGMTERALFDSWCVVVGRTPKGSERRSWIKALAGMRDDYGLKPPDVPRIIGQYRAKLGPDRNPTPGQVAGMYSQLGVPSHVTAAVAFATAHPDRGGAAQDSADEADRARRLRASLLAAGVPVAPERPAAANGHTPPGPTGG